VQKTTAIITRRTDNTEEKVKGKERKGGGEYRCCNCLSENRPSPVESEHKRRYESAC
jgi:hypothetical protein